MPSTASTASTADLPDPTTDEGAARLTPAMLEPARAIAATFAARFAGSSAGAGLLLVVVGLVLLAVDQGLTELGTTAIGAGVTALVAAAGGAASAKRQGEATRNAVWSPLTAARLQHAVPPGDLLDDAHHGEPSVDEPALSDEERVALGAGGTSVAEVVQRLQSHAGGSAR